MKLFTKNQSTTTNSLITWSPLMAIFYVIALFIAASLIGEMIVIAIGLMLGNAIADYETWLASPYMQFVSMLLIYGLMVVLLALFVKSRGSNLSALGLRQFRLRHIGMALLAIVPYVMGYGLLLAIASIVFPGLDAEQEQQLAFEPGGGTLVLIMTFISLVILPPFVEELTMRGFLFTSLMKKFRFLIATVITSVIFAVAHLQFGSGAPLLWVAALDTFMLSLVLCYLRYKSDSLWPCILLHGFKNLTAFLLIFVFQVS